MYANQNNDHYFMRMLVVLFGCLGAGAFVAMLFQLLQFGSLDEPNKPKTLLPSPPQHEAPFVPKNGGKTLYEALLFAYLALYGLNSCSFLLKVMYDSPRNSWAVQRQPTTRR